MNLRPLSCLGQSGQKECHVKPADLPTLFCTCMAVSELSGQEVGMPSLAQGVADFPDGQAERERGRVLKPGEAGGGV